MQSRTSRCVERSLWIGGSLANPTTGEEPRDGQSRKRGKVSRIYGDGDSTRGLNRKPSC
jgi:hypothetical protein